MSFNIEDLKTELEKYGTDVSVEMYDDGNVLEVHSKNKTGRSATYVRIREQFISPHYPETVVFDFGDARLKCAFKR
jgi:hypothetical protein